MAWHGIGSHGTGFGVMACHGMGNRHAMAVSWHGLPINLKNFLAHGIFPWHGMRIRRISQHDLARHNYYQEDLNLIERALAQEDAAAKAAEAAAIATAESLAHFPRGGVGVAGDSLCL